MGRYRTFLYLFLCNIDTWLLTNAANVGIVHLIGQTIRKRRLTKPLQKTVAIGVCNYGFIKNISDFQRLEVEKSFEEVMATEDQDPVNKNQVIQTFNDFSLHREI